MTKPKKFINKGVTSLVPNSALKVWYGPKRSFLRTTCTYPKSPWKWVKWSKIGNQVMKLVHQEYRWTSSSDMMVWRFPSSLRSLIVSKSQPSRKPHKSHQSRRQPSQPKQLQPEIICECRRTTLHRPVLAVKVQRLK